MFLGTHYPRLDDKGRLTLPAKFRDELAGGLMVTKGQDHCLYVFPRAEFEQMARKVAEAPFTNDAVRAYQRYLFAGTDEQRPDGQGRVSDRTGTAPVCRADQGVRGRRRVHQDGDLGRGGLADLSRRARGRLRQGSRGGHTGRLLMAVSRATGRMFTRDSGAVRPRSARAIGPGAPSPAPGSTGGRGPDVTRTRIRGVEGRHGSAAARSGAAGPRPGTVRSSARRQARRARRHDARHGRPLRRAAERAPRAHPHRSRPRPAGHRARSASVSPATATASTSSTSPTTTSTKPSTTSATRTWTVC